MKRLLVLLFFALLLIACTCTADDLPKLNGEDLNATALPDYMDDIWVPFVTQGCVNHPKDYTNSCIGTPLLVFTDKRTGLQGIADMNGEVKMEAQCPYILDHRNRGHLQNRTSYRSYIICSEGKDLSALNNKTGWIDTDTFTIDWGEDAYGSQAYFPGSGYNLITEYHDGLSIYENEKGNYGYINRNNQLVIDDIYDGATNFDSGYATVLLVSQWRIVTKDGEFPFGFKAWKTVHQVSGRKFVGQTPSGKWYLFEMPENYVKSSNSGGSSAQKSSGSQTAGNCRTSHLELGDSAVVINVNALAMFNKPNGSRTDLPQPYKDGPAVKLTDGPKCINGIIWWEVNFLGFHGWITEMGSDGTYYLQKQ